MKLLVRLLLIGSTTYLVAMYTPWWSLYIVSFLICFFIHGSMLSTFISGFLGVGAVWLGTAWVIDFKAGSTFSNQIVQLFPIEESIYLIVISGLIGGVSGGFAALTGNSFRLLFERKKVKSYYN